MFWTLLALLLWVVLGGFISYYGDLQGRRWGKKRVSWFGLRPKHTAILITSLTGAFIALCSIVSLYAIAPAVREVILRGENAIRDNKRLNTNLILQAASSKREQKKLHDSIALNQADLQKQQELNAKLRRDYGELETRRANLDKLAAGAREENANLQQQEKTLVRQIAVSNREVAQTKQNLAALYIQQARLTARNQTLSVNNGKLAKQVGLATTINRDLGRQNITLFKQNSDLASRNKNLQSEIAGGNQQIQLLRIQIKQAEYQRDELQRKKDELARNNDALERTNTNLVTYNGSLTESNKTLNDRQSSLMTRLAELEQAYQQSYTGLRQGKLILRAGAELARRTIDAHTRPELAKAELQSLQRDANATALIYGAARDENGLAVRLVNRQAMTAGAESDDARIDALATELAGRDAPIVVVANAAGNVVEGEQVGLDLRAHPVKTIFEKGEMIATRRINARQDAGRVFEAIVQFLQQDVRDAAIMAGTIPHVDPESGARQVGSLGTADLVALTERVRRRGGDVQIVAVAAAPMTSADYPLRLRFDVKRAPALSSVPVPVAPALTNPFPVGSDKRQGRQ